MVVDVSKIAESHLCSSCGACLWVCPANAITLTETIGGYVFPNIDQSTCTKCGLCLSICPGAGLNEDISNQIHYDPFIGKTKQTFIGKANNKTFYINSQSGGLVSSILSDSLKKGIIGAAITTIMVEGNPPRPDYFIVRTDDDIKKAQKSKYAPIPILSALKEINKIEKPIAIVGVSCQIHGLMNILYKFPHLKNKIAFTIGLVCDRVMTNSAIDFFISKAGMENESDKTIFYRDKSCSGYPGDVHVISNDNNSVVFPSRVRISMKDFFTPARCRLCFDKMNILADIVICDPHGINGADLKDGESVAIIRTNNGKKILFSSYEDSTISIRRIKYEDVINGQKINSKRLEFNNYLNAWKKLGYPIPNYPPQILENNTIINYNKSYEKDLQHSLNLDNFKSKEKLIKYSKKYFLYQNIKGVPNYLFDHIKKRLKKF